MFENSIDLRSIQSQVNLYPLSEAYHELLKTDTARLKDELDELKNSPKHNKVTILYALTRIFDTFIFAGTRTNIDDQYFDKKSISESFAFPEINAVKIIRQSIFHIINLGLESPSRFNIKSDGSNILEVLSALIDEKREDIFILPKHIHVSREFISEYNRRFNTFKVEVFALINDVLDKNEHP